MSVGPKYGATCVAIGHLDGAHEPRGIHQVHNPPSDGRRVLAWVDALHPGASGSWQFWRFDHDLGQWWNPDKDGYTPSRVGPTHWTELPGPPA